MVVDPGLAAPGMVVDRHGWRRGCGRADRVRKSSQEGAQLNSSESADGKTPDGCKMSDRMGGGAGCRGLKLAGRRPGKRRVISRFVHVQTHVLFVKPGHSRLESHSELPPVNTHTQQPTSASQATGIRFHAVTLRHQPCGDPSRPAALLAAPPSTPAGPLSPPGTRGTDSVDQLSTASPLPRPHATVGQSAVAQQARRHGLFEVGLSRAGTASFSRPCLSPEPHSCGVIFHITLGRGASKPKHRRRRRGGGQKPKIRKETQGPAAAWHAAKRRRSSTVPAAEDLVRPGSHPASALYVWKPAARFLDRHHPFHGVCRWLEMAW